MLLFIKKPSWLDFRKEQYNDEQIKMLTVAHTSGRSNTKLVKFKDGSMYLVNGKHYFRMNDIELRKPMYVLEKNGDYLIKDVVESKWFVHKNK